MYDTQLEGRVTGITGLVSASIPNNITEIEIAIFFRNKNNLEARAYSDYSLASACY